MKKGAKAWKAEIVRHFYGNVLTDKVETYDLSRDNTLSRWNDQDALIKHHVIRGRRVESELNVVFHLVDIVELPLVLDDSCRARIAALEAKAAERRAAAASRHRGP
ncbi:MAG: hypothetical protein E5Y67_19415 [Mesorhizobium sp.]|uniref:hypothetical protein n=1 Tax=Mesorhizobium sp. TaxID=1871066 RepID=UPI00120335FB|nr:hypothetical protein [Mesorhizobium sp.]TIM13071.1 MAG: hypothetical protein E5Y67_19415 [Mesorhizobium sp.]